MSITTEVKEKVNEKKLTLYREEKTLHIMPMLTLKYYYKKPKQFIQPNLSNQNFKKNRSVQREVLDLK